MADEIEERSGLSSACTLDKRMVMAILLEGREHPCDRCNMNRSECRGYPKKERGLTSDSEAEQFFKSLGAKCGKKLMFETQR